MSAWLILLVPVLIYLGFLLWLFSSQRKFQYFPTNRDKEGKGSTQLRPWRTEHGELLGYTNRPTAPKKVVLFFHGNGGEALDREWMADLVPSEVLLILAEYPGYGAKGGHATERLIFAEAERIADEVIAKWGNLPITVVGESLGSAVAVHIAVQKPVGKLALIAPFTSAVDLAKQRFSFLIPVDLLMKDRYETLSKVKNSRVPLHIVHGTQDEIIPFEMGKKLYDSYPGQKEMTEILGFGHNNLDDALVHSPYASKFRDFVIS